ncbi:hypothetical protein CEXT_215121 [Caerostris extrusa]|uniref:Uncharacterized protein n=1 Tax=Caerostris extrusa TaxID=172846 RepID=A0AAV4NT11_CAEEX|nr:hypothetical protein CEXT_215121 [Caerostris extrusa]
MALNCCMASLWRKYNALITLGIGCLNLLFSNHMQKCSLVKNGYLIEEIEKQPPSSAFFYQNVPSVNPITIDNETLADIFVKKGLIEQSGKLSFNTEQRLAVYDYVVAEAKKANQRNNVDLEDLMIDFEKKDDK